MMFSEFIPVVAHIISLFLFMTESYSLAWIYHSLSVQPLTDYVLLVNVAFWLLKNNAAVNMTQ